MVTLDISSTSDHNSFEYPEKEEHCTDRFQKPKSPTKEIEQSNQPITTIAIVK